MDARLNPTRIQLAEHTRVVYQATVPVDTAPEDITKPEYWAHVSNKFQPGSRIEVIPEDSSWFAELYVLSCGHAWAKVAQLRFVELAGSASDEKLMGDEQFSVGWGGPIKKFRVIRKEDKVEVKTGFLTKADAMAWIAEFERTQLV